MGIRSVSHWIVFSLALLIIVACGGNDKGASNTPPVTIEGVWIQTENRNYANKAAPIIIRVARYQKMILIKGNSYSFYEEKKEVEKGELQFDGHALHTKKEGKTHSDPVHSLTHDTLAIGDDVNVSIYKRATIAEFNQYLGIIDSGNGLPTRSPSAPDGAESLEGFWALKESREAALFVPAKPGELVFKVVNGQFESFKDGKLYEKGSISFNGIEVITVSELGRVVSKVKSFGPMRGLKIEEEKDGKLKGKAFKRITEQEFNSLSKGETPKAPEPKTPPEEKKSEEGKGDAPAADAPPAEPKEDGDPGEEPTTETDSSDGIETETSANENEGDPS